MKKQREYSSMFPTTDNGNGVMLIYDYDNDLILDKTTKKPFVGGIEFYNNGVIWVLNGKIHHPAKPAVMLGISGWKEYWLEGEQYTEEQFWEKQKDTIYAPKVMANILGLKT